MKQHRSYTPEETRYLKMLSRQYPTVRAAGTEIVNLSAILNLPNNELSRPAPRLAEGAKLLYDFVMQYK